MSYTTFSGYDEHVEDWQSVVSKYRVSGPAFRWDKIDTIVFHYTADDDLIDGDPGENWLNMSEYIRNIQKSYVDRRGYSIGYNVGIDQRGHIWELRGDTFKCAANLGWNDRSIAILCLVDGNDSLTPAAVEAAREVVAWIRSNRPNAVIRGHQDIGATACPGVGVYWQLTHGVFEPVPVPKPEPEPSNEVEMIALDYTNPYGEWTALVYTGTHLAWVVNGHADNVLNRAGVVRQTVTRDELFGIVESTIQTTPMPGTLASDPALAGAWDYD